MTERWIRVSDQDREAVAHLLQAAYARGYLDRGEFAARNTAAHAAKTRGELTDLTADLPAGPLLPASPAAAGRWAGWRSRAATLLSAGPSKVALPAMLLVLAAALIATAPSLIAVGVVLIPLAAGVALGLARRK